MTAPLYVIAPLALSPEDDRRIAAIRQAHDPQVRLVAPHFTLVFGARAAGPETAKAHVAAVAAWTAPIVWRLDRLVAAGDHLFLMPAEGEAELRALHRALYAGPFAGDLRTDIAFEPHVTVGVLPTPSQAMALATNMGRAPIDIAGRLDRLHLVAFGGARIESLGDWPFSGAGPPD